LFKKLLSKNVVEILWLCSGQVISMLLGIVSIKLLTSMGPNEFGKYSLVLSVAALVSAVFYGPAEQGFVRFYYDYSNRGVASTFLKVLYLFLILAGCGCLVLTVLAFIANNIFGKWEQTSVVIISGLYITLSVSVNIFNSFLNLLRKRKANTILQVVERCLCIGLIYILFNNKSLSFLTALAALSVAIIIVLILKISMLNTFVPADDETDSKILANSRNEIVRVVKKFSIPFGIWGVTGWMQSSSERWVIAHYLTTADVGIYALMITIANYIIAMPCGIIGQFVLPLIYKRVSSTDEKLRKEAFKIMNYLIISTATLVICASIITALFGRQTILLLGGSKYTDFWYLLPVLCIGTGLFHVGQSFTTFGMLLNVPDKYILPKVASGIIAVLSNIVLISFFGMLGISLSICFTSLAYLLLVIFINSRIKSEFVNCIV